MHVRRTWIGVGEQRADGEEHLGDGQRRAPVVLEDIEADVAVAVDVAVVDASAEHYLHEATSAHESASERERRQ